MSDLIDRQAAIDALWKALYEYEDVTEKQFIESEELDVGDWFQHRIFVQNMSDIDRQTILALPSAQPERKKGKWIPVTKIYKVTEGQFPQTHIEWVDATEPDEIDGVRCSECGTVYDFIEARNWCSECGARMER